MGKKAKEEFRRDLIRQMSAFQNGIVCLQHSNAMTGFISERFYRNSAKLL